MNAQAKKTSKSAKPPAATQKKQKKGKARPTAGAAGATSSKGTAPTRATKAKSKVPPQAVVADGPQATGLRVLLLRHAKAEDREVFAQTGLDDDLRPLTEAGRKRMRKVAKNLRSLVEPVSLLLTSPYLRAVETAEFLAAACKLDLKESSALVPEADPQVIVDWLKSEGVRGTVVLVGHDPQLPALAGWLVAGRKDAGIALGKAGACLIEFSDAIEAGRGVLRWLLTGAQLRELAD